MSTFTLSINLDFGQAERMRGTTDLQDSGTA